MPSVRDAPRKSLVRRIALASALAAAIGGTATALGAGWAATGLLSARDDDTVRSAAESLSREVKEELEEHYRNNFDQNGVTDRALLRRAYEDAIIDEIDEVSLSGARARVDDPRGVTVGALALPRLALGGCAVVPIATAPVRVCTVALDQATLTLGVSASEARARRPLLAWSALVGILIGALLGGALSYRIARWALGPLEELIARVRKVKPDAPDPEVLSPAMEYTELELLRGEMFELVERLRDALTSARGFAAEAAHELRTPLTTIAAELELLAETLGPEKTHELTAVQRRVGDLVTLVQRLLILAQQDSVAGVLQAVDLADVVETVTDGLTAERRARVEVRCDQDVLVRGDPSLLGALLTNAVDNALKFSVERVEVTVEGTEHEAVMTVSDDGPGIAEAEREKVFAVFYRSAAARRSGALGHGVGLALIAHVARRHGGSARIETARSGGTRMVVTLPRWSI